MVNYVVYFLFTRLVGGGGAQSPGLAALILDSSYQDASLAILGTLVAWAVAVAFAFIPTSAGYLRARVGIQNAKSSSSLRRALSRWEWTLV